MEGRVPAQPTAQFEQAFAHLRTYLEAAGASVGDVLEMTTYHVGLRRHLEEFRAVKDRHIGPPYPAWSAIGVSELITEGALVEIRVIARDPARSSLGRRRGPGSARMVGACTRRSQPSWP